MDRPSTPDSKRRLAPIEDRLNGEAVMSEVAEISLLQLLLSSLPRLMTSCEMDREYRQIVIISIRLDWVVSSMHLRILVITKYPGSCATGV